MLLFTNFADTINIIPVALNFGKYFHMIISSKDLLLNLKKEQI